MVCRDIRMRAVAIGIRCRNWLDTRVDRESGWKARDIAIRRIGWVYRQIGVKRVRGWLRVRKTGSMVVIARIKEAHPSTINIIREEINDRQRALRVQRKAHCSN